MTRQVRIDFVRFCVVGALGFIINFALLNLFNKVLGLPIFWAQILAAEIALFHNFMWHNKWTYKHSTVHKSFWSLIVQFHATSWVAVVGSAALISVLVHGLNLNDTIALVVSSGVVMFWNFGWTRFVIWRDKPDQTKE